MEAYNQSYIAADDDTDEETGENPHIFAIASNALSQLKQ